MKPLALALALALVTVPPAAGQGGADPEPQAPAPAGFRGSLGIAVDGGRPGEPGPHGGVAYDRPVADALRVRAEGLVTWSEAPLHALVSAVWSPLGTDSFGVLIGGGTAFDGSFQPEVAIGAEFGLSMREGLTLQVRQLLGRPSVLLVGLGTGF